MLSAFSPATCLWSSGRYLLVLQLKRLKCKPRSCKTNWIPEPRAPCPDRSPVPLWEQATAEPPNPATGQQRRDKTRFKPRFLLDICSHLGTTKGNKNVSSWTAQVLWNMCFGSKPNCARLFYRCLFLSFTAFISYPHQTCEHCEGWVTQTLLLSAVKSIIRQQNPLISLLFRVPTQALKEKGTSQRNFGNYPLPSVPQMLFCMI